MAKYMYRYEDAIDHKSVHLVLRSFRVVSETSHFCWVSLVGYAPLKKDEFARYVDAGMIKKVKKGAERSFCHVDRLSALRAYRKRKVSQARHLELQVARNTQALAFLRSKALEDLVLDAEHGADLGRHAVHDKYTWVDL